MSYFRDGDDKDAMIASQEEEIEELNRRIRHLENQLDVKSDEIRRLHQVIREKEERGKE